MRPDRLPVNGLRLDSLPARSAHLRCNKPFRADDFSYGTKTLCVRPRQHYMICKGRSTLTLRRVAGPHVPALSTPSPPAPRPRALLRQGSGRAHPGPGSCRRCAAFNGSRFTAVLPSGVCADHGIPVRVTAGERRYAAGRCRQGGKSNGISCPRIHEDRTRRPSGSEEPAGCSDGARMAHRAAIRCRRRRRAAAARGGSSGAGRAEP